MKQYNIGIGFTNKNDKEETQNILANIKYKTGDNAAVTVNKALRLYKMTIDKGIKII